MEKKRKLSNKERLYNILKFVLKLAILTVDMKNKIL